MKNLLKVLLKRFQRTEELCIMNLAFYERRASNAKYFININTIVWFTVKLGKLNGHLYFRGPNPTKLLQTIAAADPMRQGPSDRLLQLVHKLVISLQNNTNVIGKQQTVSWFTICENPQDVVKLVEGGETIKKVT